jgi:hypothetical protein
MYLHEIVFLLKTGKQSRFLCIENLVQRRQQLGLDFPQILCPPFPEAVKGH